MEPAQETKSPNIFNLFPHITEKGGECLMTTKVIYRKSTSGQLTTQGYAKAHPATTEREIVRVPSKKGR